jgi:hypothetical protein
MKNILLMMAGMLLTGIAFGHRLIRGVVINAEDQTPLIGASVQIEGNARGTVTDGFGSFQLVIEASSEILVFSFVGFEEKKIEVSEHDGQLTVMLAPSTTELSQLRVTASGMNSVNSHQ